MTIGHDVVVEQLLQVVWLLLVGLPVLPLLDQSLSLQNFLLSLKHLGEVVLPLTNLLQHVVLELCQLCAFLQRFIVNFVWRIQRFLIRLENGGLGEDGDRGGSEVTSVVRVALVVAQGVLFEGLRAYFGEDVRMELSFVPMVLDFYWLQLLNVAAFVPRLLVMMVDLTLNACAIRCVGEIVVTLVSFMRHALFYLALLLLKIK